MRRSRFLTILSVKGSEGTPPPQNRSWNKFNAVYSEQGGYWYWADGGYGSTNVFNDDYRSVNGYTDYGGVNVYNGTFERWGVYDYVGGTPFTAWKNGTVWAFSNNDRTITRYVAYESGGMKYIAVAKKSSYQIYQEGAYAFSVGSYIGSIAEPIANTQPNSEISALSLTYQGTSIINGITYLFYSRGVSPYGYLAYALA